MIERILPDEVEAQRLSTLEEAAFGSGHSVWSPVSYLDQSQLDGTAIFADPEIEEGFVVVRQMQPEAEILNLAVHPVARRSGLGRALMRAAEDWVRREGATTMFLEVALDAVPARQLYQTLGYRMIGRRRGYYSRGEAARVDALVMMKALDAAD